MCEDTKPAGRPLFVETLAIHPVVKRVVVELESFLDTREVAAWFCEPNLWLGDRRPVELVDDCPDCVLGAARADRFIALEVRAAFRPLR